jgi:hypothetical protein
VGEGERRREVTNEQLFMAIGIPVILNAAMWLAIHSRIGSMETSVHKLLDAYSKAWESNLRRVEEVMDARLKHIEEELKR